MFWARRPTKDAYGKYVYTSEGVENEERIDDDDACKALYRAIENELMRSEFTVLFIGELDSDETQRPLRQHLSVLRLLETNVISHVITTSADGLLRWAGN